MLKLRFFYLIVFFLLPGSVFSQDPDLNFMNLGSREGLSSNIVSSILKDRFGYMWFGTDDGLNKFDGKQFTVYRHNEDDSTSIISNEILDLFEDKEGNLWIGTGSGLMLYNRKMDSFINYKRSINRPIISISSGYNGKLWMGSYTGLVIFDPKTEKVSPFNPRNNADRAGD